MHEKTNKVIFRSSSDTEPTVRVNALVKRPEKPDKKTMGEVEKYFQELEEIIQND